MQSSIGVQTLVVKGRHNLSTARLLELAVLQKEGVLSATGALSVETGARTGRSPKDRYVVKDELTERTVDWGTVNQPLSKPCFDALWTRVLDYLKKQSPFSGDYSVGADPQYGVQVRAFTELAWHQLFVRNLFINQTEANASSLEHWTLLQAPNFLAEPSRDGVRSEAAIILNFSDRKILICGTHYAGEMKKALFSVLNYLLPAQSVLPMHCAANQDALGQVTLFFGLSGTGKTTLSADPRFALIGDDEHGWHREGVFNFEGGCYAKCINLSQKNEPTIWDAIRFGAVMENVVLDGDSRIAQFDDGRLTQNTRVAYPRSHIAGAVPDNKGSVPKAVVFLTCDLYGVLPPVSILTPTQAAYHFLSGYTALVGSTEMGNDNHGIKPVFSTCFGAPFFPRAPQVYAELLMKRLAESHCPVYLVNTGWTGGPYGQGGKRFDIPTTRAIIHAIQSGALQQAETETVTDFKLQIPTRLPGVAATLLNPILSWPDAALYHRLQQQLIAQFAENFKRFHASEAILAGGPTVSEETVVL